MTFACNSLSITHGPAIRNRGLPAPRRSLPNSISCTVPIRIYEDTTPCDVLWGIAGFAHSSWADLGHRAGRGPQGRCRLALSRSDRSRARSLFLMFQRCTDERSKQRMRLQRLGFEFRMELASQKPRMLGRLDNLHIIFVRRASGNFQSRSDQRFLEVAVEF